MHVIVSLRAIMLCFLQEKPGDPDEDVVIEAVSGLRFGPSLAEVYGCVIAPPFFVVGHFVEYGEAVRSRGITECVGHAADRNA